MSDDNEQRDDRVYRMRLLGISPRTIADQVGCTIADINAIVDARLPKLSNEFRAQSMRLDLERTDQIISHCVGQMAKGSLAAGHLLLKTREVRADLLGTRAPLRVDPVQLVETINPETSTAELRRAFYEEFKGEPVPPALPN